MLLSLSFLQQALTKANPPRAIARFWFACSLFFATLYASLALRKSFSSPFVVQDDARHHVFWTQRFADPELLPGDLIADYFQSVAPVGYSNLYKLAAGLGLDPLIFNKYVPFALGILTVAVAFYFFLELIPIPAVSFLGTLLFIQNAWMDDEIGSGTPRAFIYVLLLGFLWALSRRSLLGCIVTLLLQGLFYPPTVLLSAGTALLQLVRFEDGKPQLSREFQDYRFSLICFGVAVAVLLPHALANSPYGPQITLAEAKIAPEFQESGRTKFFVSDPFEYWLKGRSGLFDKTILKPFPLMAALLFPVLQWRRLSLLTELTAEATILLRLAVTSLGTFILAHIVLFKLYLPSRYTQHSVRIVLAFFAAVVLIALLDEVLRWAIAAGDSLPRQIFAGLTCGVLGLCTMGYPLSRERFIHPSSYITSDFPQLYEFLQQQPKNTLVASLSRTTDNISTFGRRPVLFSREQSVPYHRSYYARVDRRVRDVIRAQYAPDLDPARETIRRYGIDLWLLDRDAFGVRYFKNNLWFRQFQPETENAIAQLRSTDEFPAMAADVNRCTVFADAEHVVLSASCLLQQSSDRQP